MWIAKFENSFVNIYTDNMVAYTRNRTLLIQDSQTLSVFIAMLREECSAPIDTIVVDEINVSNSFFDELEEANELLTKENINLIVDKRLLAIRETAKFSNISCQHPISEAEVKTK